MADEIKNNNTKEAVATSVGVVHAMPKEYQGGIIPAWSKASTVENKKLEVKMVAPVEKQKVEAPKPVVPVKKEALPTSKKTSGSKRRVLIIVGAAVLVVMLIAATIVVLADKLSNKKEAEVPVVTVPEPVTPVVTGPTPEPFKLEPVAGRDTDSDGLSDIEERMFGSNTRLPDTDRDGFLDGNEVFNQYDPLRTSPAKLLERYVVKKFEDASIGWTFLYPSLWGVAVKSDEAGKMSVLVTIASGEIMEFSAESKTNSELTLEDYVNGETDFEFTKTKSGLPMATEQSQMKTYIDLGDDVLAASYSLNGKNTIDFVSSFQMILNSITAL